MYRKFKELTKEELIQTIEININPYTGLSILQIHHVDGDCTNNSEENLELLCPNCLAMTENYGSLNKGKATRIDNRMRY